MSRESEQCDRDKSRQNDPIETCIQKISRMNSRMRSIEDPLYDIVQLIGYFFQGIRPITIWILMWGGILGAVVFVPFFLGKWSNHLFHFQLPLMKGNWFGVDYWLIGFGTIAVTLICLVILGVIITYGEDRARDQCQPTQRNKRGRILE